MVFRFLIRFFSNNEQLVRRLSESYPVRRAAQIVVQAFVKGKQITQDSGLKENISQFDIKSFWARFSENIKSGVKDLKQDYDSNRKRQQ